MKLSNYSLSYAPLFASGPFELRWRVCERRQGDSVDRALVADALTSADAAIMSVRDEHQRWSEPTLICDPQRVYATHDSVEDDAGYTTITTVSAGLASSSTSRSAPGRASARWVPASTTTWSTS